MPRKKIVPKQTTIDELVSSPNHKHFNVSFGDLKRFVEKNEDLDDNAVVLVQRVEDFYYDENNWKVVLEEGDALLCQTSVSNTASVVVSILEINRNE